MPPKRKQSWTAYLDEPVDGASLGVFRIVFGAMVAIDAYRYVTNGWVEEYFVRPKLHFTYLYFGWVHPLPAPWIYGHFYFIGAMAVLVSLGLFYRWACVGLFLSYTYFFLLEQSTYMNHYYLIALISFLLCTMPAQRCYSLDRLRGATVERSVPRWCVLILRFQLFVVYFYGAIAKLNPDWLAGEPMYSELVRGGPEIPEIANLLPPAILAYAIAYSGVLIDTAVPIMLSTRSLRRYGFLLAVGFHVLNAIFLRIGVFSYLMVGAITIFFDPDWPRQLARRCSSLIGRHPSQPRLVVREGHTRWPLFALLYFYVALQLLVPFRHLLFPGPVSWTEEGHRFAWQMKLRKKRSRIVITARDPATGRTWTIDPNADLIARQQRKLATFPDIMLQYAHYTRDRLVREGIADPEIRVDYMCSLNGAPYAPLIDPQVDLAKVERTWRHSWWILPKPPRRTEP